jgi:phenylalanyl-tRNA synthetase beta chain
LNNDSLKEIINVQEKLHDTFLRHRKKAAIGIYPLDKIKFPIYFRALPPEKISFVPLGENSEMSAKEILLYTETGKKYSALLEGKSKYPVFIDSSKQVLSMPPIINSETTGKVSENTKNLFIEVSGFDLNFLEKTLNILSALFYDIGGEIYSVNHFYGKKKIILPNLNPVSITLHKREISRNLGLQLKDSEIENLLKKMLYSIKTKTKDSFVVQYPAFRTDVLREIDVVDDIARAYGFNNFVPRLPEIHTIANASQETKFSELLSKSMTSLGFQEVMTLILTNSQKQFKKMQLQKSKPWENYIPVPSASENSLDMLRISIIPELLELAYNNKDKEHPIRLFELDSVIVPCSENRETLSKDFLKLSALIVHSKADFTDSRQTLQALSRILGLKLEIRVSDYPFLIPGRQGDIYFKGKKAGFVGDINPQVLDNFNLKMPATCFELDFNTLFSVFSS